MCLPPPSPPLDESFVHCVNCVVIFRFHMHNVKRKHDTVARSISTTPAATVVLNAKSDINIVARKLVLTAVSPTTLDVAERLQNQSPDIGPLMFPGARLGLILLRVPNGMTMTRLQFRNAGTVFLRVWVGDRDATSDELIAYVQQPALLEPPDSWRVAMARKQLCPPHTKMTDKTWQQYSHTNKIVNMRAFPADRHWTVLALELRSCYDAIAPFVGLQWATVNGVTMREAGIREQKTAADSSTDHDNGAKAQQTTAGDHNMDGVATMEDGDLFTLFVPYALLHPPTRKTIVK